MSRNSDRTLTRFASLRLALASVLAVGGLVVMPSTTAQAATNTVLNHPAPVEERSASTVTSDVLPTAQIDSGVVWALKIVGNTVYAGGSFSAARPAGSTAGNNTVPRSNLLAFNLTTGALTSFAPTFNGQVKSLAASPDGSRLYVGGSFTQVNGQTRFNFAAFDTATGNLLTNFKPAVGGSYVNAIVATSSTVYVGGLLGAGNGVTRKNLIAFDTSGNLLGWAPTTDLQVDTMVMNTSGDRLIIGGRFGVVNDVSQRGLAALDPATGAILPWTAPSIIKDGYPAGTSNAGKSGIYSLSTDGNAIYGTGWVYASVTVGNLEGSFSADPETGDLNWVEDCHGDTYSSYSDGTTVYETGHPHDCESVGGYPQKAGTPGNMHNSKAWTAAAKGTLWRSPRVNSIYANWEGYPSPAMVHWFPDWTTGSATGQGQAGWTIAGSGDYLVVGGEFPYVNGKTQQGLVRFARPNVSASKDGPRLSGADWTPSVVSATAGTARITIPGNWDRDNTTLTYKITRSGLANPIYTTTMTSYFWYQPSVTFLDQGLTPGNTYTYQVSATDPDGNKVVSASTSVTVSGTSAGAYAQQVLADGATLYWRLGDTGSAADVLTTNNYGLKGSGVTVASSGAVGFGVGSHFSGTSSGRIGSNLQVGSLDGFSEEIWFKTTSSSGGKLIGFGSSQSNTSSTYDRHLYMSNNGQLNFGIFQDNTARVITSPGTYRDGNWHQAVATSGPDGAALYVDGALVGSDPTMIKAQYYLGYWRVGGDSTSGWPNRGSSDYFAGDLDEFSVYSQTLTPAQVSAQYAAAVGAQTPTASFTNQVSDLHVAVDGSGTTAANGASIVSYNWDFGDGTAASTGVTATHDYAAGGTYTVTLSVTDSNGLVGSTTSQVTVAPPHQAPTPSFTSSVAGLTASVDASASTATDGATLGYDWNWGDGTSHGTGKTAQHTYASSGDKTVTLTLTDSLGLSSTLTKTVTVTHIHPAASFTASTNGLAVSVDASASSASDGATMTYAWDWGDGSSAGSGKTASHTYAAAGSYPVTLTVTDSLAATDTTSTTVTVVDQTSTVVANAVFDTPVSSGWGTANKGGAWTTSGSGFSVSGGEGLLSLGAGATRKASLDAVSAQNVDGSVEVALAKVPSGGRVDVNFELRKSSAGDYRAKIRFLDGGAVSVQLTKLVSGTATILSQTTLAGYTYTAGEKVNVDFQVNGDGSSTTLKTKVWGASQAEPSGWTLTATDSTAALQPAGAVGFEAYAQSALANGPIVLSFDNLTVTTPQPAHADPVASFTASTSDLAVSVDASASSASDGATMTYAWDWGDGSSAGSGKTASHTYAAAGDYTVKLTVTDSLGGKDTASKTVTVTAPQSPTVVAKSTFGTDASSGWGTANTGGAWTTSGSGFSVSGGEGLLSLGASSTRRASLDAVSAQNVDGSVEVALAKVPSGGRVDVNYDLRKSSAGSYRAKIRFLDGGAVSVQLTKLVSGTATIFSQTTLAGYTYTAGEKVNVDFQVNGDGSSTTLKTKVWGASQAEPSGWTLTATDSTAALQPAGAVGFEAYAQSALANGPIVLSFDNLLVSTLG